MRFITEFELATPFEIKNYKKSRSFAAAQMLGIDIAKSIGWEDCVETSISEQPKTEKCKIEIEAFPMDKWIEFKEKILGMKLYYPNDSHLIEQYFKELESFGKPS